MIELDETDRALLRALSRDATQSVSPTANNPGTEVIRL